MEIKSNLCSNAIRKIGLLITKASELGMEIDITPDEGPNSGNVYLWLEDYAFTLYIGLGSDDIYALWINPEDGEEIEIEVEGSDLSELESWANALYNDSQEV